jgi:hypothetical protein
VVSKTFTQDDFVTLGVVENSIGLIEREESLGLFHVERRFEMMNPIDSNTFTGRWTPPLGRKLIINQVKSSQAAGTSEVAVYFLIAQPFSGTAASGRSIQVSDTAGTLIESIDGLNFQGGFNVFPIHIALHPADRTGYVNGPDLTRRLQSFSY